ncbi:hypothetical protein ACFLXY_11410, partial [Chloroflexota bacterium]
RIMIIKNLILILLSLLFFCSCTQKSTIDTTNNYQETPDSVLPEVTIMPDETQTKQVQNQDHSINVSINTSQVTNKMIAILIGSNIADGISQLINQFEDDLHNDGYVVVEKIWHKGDCHQVRNYLIDLYSSETSELVGAYLIGDIPFAYFNLYYPASENTLERGPWEFITMEYYQDLDGEWNKINPQILWNENAFDSHTGKTDNEIWISVLPFFKDISTTIEKINLYLEKNHKYRTGIDRPENGYIEPICNSWGITTPDLYEEQVDYCINSKYSWYPLTIRGNVGIFPDNTMNNVLEYPDFRHAWDNEMCSNKYDFATICFHNCQFAWISWLANNAMTVNFVWDNTCSFADISKPSSMFDVNLLYDDGNVVLIAGATTFQGGLGGNINGDFRWNIAHDLVNGLSFGEAYLNHTNTLYASPYEEQKEYFGAQFIFLGDPTLKLQEHMSIIKGVP